MITFTKDDLSYERGTTKEWIVTNGLGGYASSTLLNINTRKYHGLLITSMQPPVQRVLQLVKIEETLHQHDTTYELGANRYPGTVHPHGYDHLESVIVNVFPTFVYNVQGNIIKKSIVMPHATNATLITYKFITKEPYTFTARPLVNARSIHDIVHAAQMRFHQYANEKTTTIRSAANMPLLILGSDKGTYHPDEDFVYNMEYTHELARGYDFREDHWTPGTFRYSVQPGVSRLTLLATGGNEHDAYTTFDAFYQNHAQPLVHVFDYEKARIQRLIDNTCALHSITNDLFLTHLITAADSFIVHRATTDAKNVIAGYPWFTDWGRDALISFPGLFLIPGRFDDAREFLTGMTRTIRNGLLPNTHDENNTPSYNSVDAPLWFILAADAFARATGDYRYVRDTLWTPMQQIITAYLRGTDYHIFADKDGLLSAGTPETNLTWMDAQTNGKAITNRHGKAVEINALWYNSLKIMESFAAHYGADAQHYNQLAAITHASFTTTFWNPHEQCLYDVVRPNDRDASIRPNQIYAVALPHRLLSADQEYLVVKRVKDELLTPYGLRSLSKYDARFRRHYTGNQAQRDQSYHNGTAWAYLLGPFIRAYLRVHNERPEARQECEEKIIKYLIESIRDYGIGTLNEISDGTFPYEPRGCPSQAWSVAELLRVYVENIKKRS